MRLLSFVAILFAVCVLAVVLTGCATPAVPTSGNHQCHPSADLPAHKTMKKLPETDQQFADLFSLFAEERRQHAQDDRDYNSLHDQCVDPTWSHQ